MARTKTNKSAGIRKALETTPDKSVAEIAKDFGVTPGLVYNVKAKLKGGGKKKKKPGRKPGVKAAAPHGAHVALDSAFEFVTKVGGLLHAEQLIGKLRSIKERL
jgi:transposase